MWEKLILSLIVTMILQLQLAVKSETLSPKMPGSEQVTNHEMIREIANRNLEDVLRWLKQKKTMLN
ncbi:MAG: hypothetical protein AB4352_09355 [Hormoscilla sp.]